MENNSKPHEPEESDAFENNNGDWFKVIIIGDAGVGKTSILLRYIENKFVPTTTSIGYISDRKKLVMVNGKEVQLHIWDTAGQVRELFMPLHVCASEKSYVIFNHNIKILVDLKNRKNCMSESSTCSLLNL